MERDLPHTSDDDDTRYRPPEELEEARKHDPLARLQEHLLANGYLTAAEDEVFRAEARKQVDEATELAESAPYPTTDTFYDHVYSDSRGAP